MRSGTRPLTGRSVTNLQSTGDSKTSSIAHFRFKERYFVYNILFFLNWILLKNDKMALKVEFFLNS